MLVGELHVTAGGQPAPCRRRDAVADTADIDVATARTQVRVATALRTHPLLDAAMATGDDLLRQSRSWSHT